MVFKWLRNIRSLNGLVRVWMLFFCIRPSPVLLPVLGVCKVWSELHLLVWQLHYSCILLTGTCINPPHPSRTIHGQCNRTQIWIFIIHIAYTTLNAVWIRQNLLQYSDHLLNTGYVKSIKNPDQLASDLFSTTGIPNTFRIQIQTVLSKLQFYLETIGSKQN